MAPRNHYKGTTSKLRKRSTRLCNLQNVSITFQTVALTERSKASLKWVEQKYNQLVNSLIHRIDMSSIGAP